MICPNIGIKTIIRNSMVLAKQPRLPDIGWSPIIGDQPMSGNRGCLANTILFLIIVFIPILGHIIETIMILEDDHSTVGKLIWLAVIWFMPPFVIVGPL